MSKIDTLPKLLRIQGYATSGWQLGGIEFTGFYCAFIFLCVKILFVGFEGKVLNSQTVKYSAYIISLFGNAEFSFAVFSNFRFLPWDLQCVLVRDSFWNLYRV